jgi:hypothetical protein
VLHWVRLVLMLGGLPADVLSVRLKMWPSLL